jgi:hypothetical protein
LILIPLPFRVLYTFEFEFEKRMEYNTQRANLKLREYGRNVQNLVAHIKAEPDKEKRNQKAQTLVELMKQVNPNLNKESDDYDQKIWDDVFIISDFDIDVDTPYTKPEPAMLNKKPERLKYFSNEIQYKHFGRSIELLIEKARKLEDPKEKEGAVIVLGKLMKSFFQTWNKDAIEDEQVLKMMKRMSQNELDIDIENVKEFNLFDLGKPVYRPRRNQKHKGGSSRKGSQNNRRRRYSR